MHTSHYLQWYVLRFWGILHFGQYLINLLNYRYVPIGCFSLTWLIIFWQLHTRIWQCNKKIRQILSPTKNKIKIKDVLFRRAENEEHTYFVKKVPEDTELVFCEKGKSGFYIKWINLESFGDEEVIKIPDMRTYFIDNVIPFIKSNL